MLNKANWQSDGERINVSLPIAKINKEARTVSGFATLDNLDQQGDVISAEASEKAFSRWRGNVREMHQPLAVGKAVDFSATEFFDPESAKTYRGIFTTVYVSKGAEATWQKVLDGTLTGFSIGGKILEKADEINKSTGQSQRVIKDYELVELSLVDSPCNQLANIMTIQKNAGGEDTIKGLAVDVRTQNVFRCADDNLIQLTDSESAECASCDKTMTNIGWVEDTEGKEQAVKALLNTVHPVTTTTNSSSTNSTFTIKYDSANGGWSLTPSGAATFSTGTLVQKDSTGGVEMAKQDEKAEETEATETVEETEQPEGVQVEKAAEVEELETPAPATPDLNELFEKFSERVETVLGTVRDESTAAIEKAENSFTEAVGGVETKVSDLEKALDEKFTALESRVKSIEDSSAIKKSAEVTPDSEEKVEKAASSENFWRGSILSANDLTN